MKSVVHILNIGNITGIAMSILFALYMAFMPLIHEGFNSLWKRSKMKRFALYAILAEWVF